MIVPNSLVDFMGYKQLMKSSKSRECPWWANLMDEVMTTADARLGRAALKMARSAILSTQTPPSSSPPSSLLPSNLPLLSAFLAFALAQFLKLFTNWYKEKRWDSKRMVDSGGMPSSHSATVTALAMAIGLQEGTGSAAFAIAVVLACVVMYDASGIRLHAGRQAELLNQIMCEFPPEHPLSSVRPLRELLGHTPFQDSIPDISNWFRNLMQVVVGGIVGCIVSYLMRNTN
ncbi:Uncharacterized membrane protein YuiD [Linum perenne]